MLEMLERLHREDRQYKRQLFEMLLLVPSPDSIVCAVVMTRASLGTSAPQHSIGKQVTGPLELSAKSS